MTLSTIDFSKTQSFQALSEDRNRLSSIQLKALFEQDSNRQERFSLLDQDIFLDYSKNILDQATFSHLIALAAECGLKDAIKAQYTGAKINQNENRAVLHTALRAKPTTSITVDGDNIIPAIQAVKAHMKDFTNQVISGAW